MVGGETREKDDIILKANNFLMGFSTPTAIVLLRVLLRMEKKMGLSPSTETLNQTFFSPKTMRHSQIGEHKRLSVRMSIFNRFAEIGRAHV